MADRERLLELLNVNTCPNKICNFCEHFRNTSACERYKMERIADHLIQNGVTIATDNNVPSWIPVMERLPTYDDADENGDIIAHHKIRGVRVVCVDNITRNPERYTHWMSLPEPPKEVE